MSGRYALLACPPANGGKGCGRGVRPSLRFRAIPLRVPPVFLFFVVVQRRAVKAPVPAAGAEGGLAVPAEGVLAEGLVRILPETGLAEAIAVGTAEVATGRTVPLVIEAGEGRTTLLSVLPFVSVTVVETPGTEAVLAERLSLVVTARAEGATGFFPITMREAVATGMEGAFVLSIPAEGRAGLRGLATIPCGIREGTRAEGLVSVLPETGLAETVAVGTAEVTAGGLVLLVIEAGKGTRTLPGVLSFATVAIVEAPGTESVLAERLTVIFTARTEGTPVFFAIAVHETVTTGTEGAFVLSIPAEGRAGLRGLVTIPCGIGEGTRAEGLVPVLPETGLAEAVAVGTAELAAGSLVLLAIDAGKGTRPRPGVLAFVAV